MSTSKRNSRGVLRTEQFKRPDHDDFRTTAELAASDFSGLRHNSITDDMEIWVLGEIRRIVTRREQALDSDALSKAYADVFALDSVTFYNPQAN